MTFNPGVAYTLAEDIDLSVVTNPSDVWNPATGFVPIGLQTPFTGSLSGQDHTIANLFIDLPSQEFTGLFAYVTGTGNIHDLTLNAVNVTGANQGDYAFDAPT